MAENYNKLAPKGTNLPMVQNPNAVGPVTSTGLGTKYFWQGLKNRAWKGAKGVPAWAWRNKWWLLGAGAATQGGRSLYEYFDNQDSEVNDDSTGVGRPLNQRQGGPQLYQSTGEYTADNRTDDNTYGPGAGLYRDSETVQAWLNRDDFHQDQIGTSNQPVDPANYVGQDGVDIMGFNTTGHSAVGGNLGPGNKYSFRRNTNAAQVFDPYANKGSFMGPRHLNEIDNKRYNYMRFDYGQLPETTDVYGNEVSASGEFMRRYNPQYEKAHKKMGRSGDNPVMTQWNDPNPVHWSEDAHGEGQAGYVTRNYEADMWEPGAVENLGTLPGEGFLHSQIGRIGGQRYRNTGRMSGGDKNSIFQGLFGSSSNVNLSGRHSIKGHVKGYVEGNEKTGSGMGSNSQSDNAIEKYLEGKNITKTSRRGDGSLNIQRDKVKRKGDVFVRKTGEGFLGLGNRKKYIDGVEQEQGKGSKLLNKLFGGKKGEEEIIDSPVPEPTQDDGQEYFAGSENLRQGGTPTLYRQSGQVPIPGSDATVFMGDTHEHDSQGIPINGNPQALAEGGGFDSNGNPLPGETMDKVNLLKQGRPYMNNYVFSDYLNTDGTRGYNDGKESISDKHMKILRQGGNQRDIDLLARLQEKLRDGGDPDKIARQGGIPNIYQSEGELSEDGNMRWQRGPSGQYEWVYVGPGDYDGDGVLEVDEEKNLGMNVQSRDAAYFWEPNEKTWMYVDPQSGVAEQIGDDSALQLHQSTNDRDYDEYDKKTPVSTVNQLMQTQKSKTPPPSSSDGNDGSPGPQTNTGLYNNITPEMLKEYEQEMKDLSGYDDFDWNNPDHVMAMQNSLLGGGTGEYGNYLSGTEGSYINEEGEHSINKVGIDGKLGIDTYNALIQFSKNKGDDEKKDEVIEETPTPEPEVEIDPSGDYKKPRDLSWMLPVLGFGAQMIAPLKAMKLKPHLMTSGIMGSQRLHRVNANDQLSRNAGDFVALKRFIGNSGGGPANISNIMMAQANKFKQDIQTKAENDKTNASIANAEAKINANISAENQKNTAAAAKFNAEQKTDLDNTKINAWQAFGQNVSGFASDYLKHLDNKKTIAAIDGSTGIYNRSAYIRRNPNHLNPDGTFNAEGEAGYANYINDLNTGRRSVVDQVKGLLNNKKETTA